MGKGSTLCGLCAKLTVSWLELSSADCEFTQHLLSCTDEDAPSKVCKKCYYKVKEVKEFVHEAQQAILLLKENQDIKVFVETRPNSVKDEEITSYKNLQQSADSEDTVKSTVKISSNKSLKRISFSSTARKGEEDEENIPLSKRQNSRTENITLPPESKSNGSTLACSRQSADLENDEIGNPPMPNLKKRQSSSPTQKIQEIPPKRKGRPSRIKSTSDVSSQNDLSLNGDFCPSNETMISSRPRRENTPRPKKYFDENMDVTLGDSDEEKVPRNSGRRSHRAKEMDFENSNVNDGVPDRMIYPEDQPYQCELCSTCFNNKALFVQHLRREHPDIPEGVVRTIEGDSSKIESETKQNSRNNFCDRCNVRLSKTSPSEVARHYKSKSCRDAYEALQVGH